MTIRRRSKLFALCATAALSLGAALPAHAEWLRGETEHFIIYGDTSEGNVRAYARKVERFDALLRLYYPVAVDHDIPKLEIFMANGFADLRRVEPEIGRSVVGFYTPNSGRIFAVANTESEMADDVIFHEYSHHFMFQMTGAAYPSWFVEGFAEYYNTIRIRDDSYQVGRNNPGRMNSLTQPVNSWAPMEDVLRWRVSRFGTYRGADYYAVAWALAHYFLSDPTRTQQLGAYLAAVSQGGDPIDALNGTINRTPAQLQQDIHRYLSGAIPAFTPQIAVPNPEVVITRMTPNEGRLAWLDLRLDSEDPRAPEPHPEKREGETDAAFAERVEETHKAFVEGRETLVREALTAAEQNPDDPASLRVKARAQRLAADPAAAIATLEPLTTAESEDARALRFSAEAYLDRAEDAEGAERTELIRQARDRLAQSLDINPLDFLTYLDLDRMREGASGYPNANDLSILEVANAIAPQSFDARMRYARAQMATGDPHAAILTLTPVANSPHGGALRAAGRRLLAQARVQAGLAPAEDDEPAPDEGEPGDAAPDS